MSITQVSSREAVVERLFTELVGLGRVLKARGADWGHVDAELSRADVHALGVLATQDAMRPGQLAATLCVDPSAVSRQLVTLVALGLVERQADPADRRAELVSLTDAGRDRLVHVRSAMCAALGGRLADWELDDLDRAATLAGRLTLRLNEPITTTKDTP